MRYWIWWNDLVQGPFEPEELSVMRAFSEDLLVCLEGREDWLPASRVADLSSAVEQLRAKKSEPLVPPPPPPSRPPTVSPIQGEFYIEPQGQQHLLDTEGPKGPIAYRETTETPEFWGFNTQAQVTMPFHFVQAPRMAPIIEVELPVAPTPKPRIEFTPPPVIKESPIPVEEPPPPQSIPIEILEEPEPAPAPVPAFETPVEAPPEPAPQRIFPILPSDYDEAIRSEKRLQWLPWILGVALAIAALGSLGFWIMDKASTHSAIAEAQRLETHKPTFQASESVPVPAVPSNQIQNSLPAPIPAETVRPTQPGAISRATHEAAHSLKSFIHGLASLFSKPATPANAGSSINPASPSGAAASVTPTTSPHAGTFSRTVRSVVQGFQSMTHGVLSKFSRTPSAAPNVSVLPATPHIPGVAVDPGISASPSYGSPSRVPGTAPQKMRSHHRHALTKANHHQKKLPKKAPLSKHHAKKNKNLAAPTSVALMGVHPAPSLPGVGASAVSAVPAASPAQKSVPAQDAAPVPAKSPWAGKQNDAIDLAMAKTLPKSKITVGQQAKAMLQEMHEKELLHAADTGERLYLPDKMTWSSLEEDGSHYRVYLNFLAMQANGERVQTRSYQFLVDLQTKWVQAADAATQQDLLTQPAELTFKHNPMATDIDSILGGVDTYNRHKLQAIIFKDGRHNKIERKKAEDAMATAKEKVRHASIYFRRTYPEAALQNVAKAYEFSDLLKN